MTQLQMRNQNEKKDWRISVSQISGIIKLKELLQKLYSNMVSLKKYFYLSEFSTPWVCITCYQRKQLLTPQMISRVNYQSLEFYLSLLPNPLLFQTELVLYKSNLEMRGSKAIPTNLDEALQEINPSIFPYLYSENSKNTSCLQL